MIEAAIKPLADWESFYVIVGSSGAALTGLQFVVIALIADSKRQTTTREIQAFGTPTIVHFCAVLLVSAILSAPWHSLRNVAMALGVSGLVGLGYSLIIFRRARRQTGYKPVFEDLLFYALLPLIGYGLLFIGAFLLPGWPQRVLFLIAAVALLLLFLGIHNAWDTVTYIAVARPQAERETTSEGKTEAT
jgi:hypothetical protein